MNMWKENWEDTKRHLVDWWNREGLVLGEWGSPLREGAPHENTTAPMKAQSVREQYCAPELRARRNHHDLARRSFPADVLPISSTDIGPGSLALFLGSEPGVEGGGSPRWFDMYRRILEAGKSVQVVGCYRDEVLPLLDAIGGKGVYVMTSFSSSNEAEAMMAKVEQYR
jgi:hypothetical protein